MPRLLITPHITVRYTHDGQIGFFFFWLCTELAGMFFTLYHAVCGYKQKEKKLEFVRLS